MSDASNAHAEFNPARLRFARERRGLNKEELASRCGVTRRAVSDWEAGRVDQPPIRRLSEVLDFPASFFFGEDVEEIAPDAVSFRALSSMSPRQMRRVIAHASLLRKLSVWIDNRYATPAVQLPSFEELTASVREQEPSAVDAATSLRMMWRLGAKPIPEMLALA
jgi:transcriptional regulator with XRE-family HTH domain